MALCVGGGDMHAIMAAARAPDPYYSDFFRFPVNASAVRDAAASSKVYGACLEALDE